MSTGLEITWNVLSRTRNEAAVPILAAALDSSDAPIRLSALSALLARPSDQAYAEIFARTDRFGPAECKLLAEAPGLVDRALAQVLRGGDSELGITACQFISALRAYDLIPVLLNALPADNDQQTSRLATTVLELAAQLGEESIATRRCRRADELAALERDALAAIEDTLQKFDSDPPANMVEAFLILAPPDHPNLVTFLSDRDHPLRESVVHGLKTSRAVGVIQLLLRYLSDATVSSDLLQIIAGRKDRRFVKRLLAQLRPKPSLSVLANMGRCQRVSWLESVESLLPLDGDLQAVALELAVAAGINRQIVFNLAAELLQHGQPEGRTASCLALGTHFNAEANQLLIQAVKDPDPTVVAAAVKQLRQRRIPLSLERVVVHLNEQGEERAKANDVANNVRFDRFAKCFDQLDQATRQKIGEMVLRSDPAAVDGLKTLLASDSPDVLRQAIDMAAAMGAAFQVSGQLFKLLDHKDAEVRRTAARALLARRSTARNAIADLAPRPAIPWRMAS